MIDLNSCDLTSASECDSESRFFLQTLLIVAEVTKWAFGEETSHARWHELYAMVDDWENTRPSAFNPIYLQPRNPEIGRLFPQICYLTDEHVEAAHFFYLAKLLLTTHDPNIPRIGPRVKSATAQMQETALSYVRILVGIARCNNFAVARFTANLALIVCGNWFTDRPEQGALLDYLRETSDCTGWESRGTEDALKKAWAWEVE